jgi:preprotein translocase subunit SecA
MAFNPLTYIFGSRNDRLLKTYRKTLERINVLEVPLEALSDEKVSPQRPWASPLSMAMKVSLVPR